MIWSRTTAGLISYPSTVTAAVGGPYVVVATSVAIDPVHQTGGSFWVLKEGPNVGFLVSFHSNELGYGSISVTTDAVDDRTRGTPHVNPLADWRLLIKDLGPVNEGAHLLTFNDTTAIWSRTTGGIISWPSTVDAAPGGPYRVNPIVVPYDPVHETGGSFWVLKEGPNLGYLVSYHSNSLGYGDITVTAGEQSRGPGETLATLYHPNAHLAGFSQMWNAGGEIHFTLLVDDPNILMPKPKENHVTVEFFDEDEDAWVEDFAGVVWDMDATETEVVFYGIDYLALYQFTKDERFDVAEPERAAPTGSKYTGQTIQDIVTAQLTYSKGLANSWVGFITIGDICPMPYEVDIYSTFHDTLSFVTGLLDSWRAGTGKLTRISVEKTEAGGYEVIVVDDPGVQRDELRLQYGDLVQGYRVVPHGTNWATRVNFIGRQLNGLKAIYKTINSTQDEARFGRIAGEVQYQESIDEDDLARRALQAAIDASRQGKQIGVGTKLGSYRPFEGYRLCDMVPVDINHGAVNTQDWNNSTFGEDEAEDPSTTAALWAIVGIRWESFDDGHWITTPLLYPKGRGPIAASCSTVLGRVSFASATDHVWSAGFPGTVVPMTVDIEPTVGVPTLLFSYTISVAGDVPTDHAMTVPAGYTLLDSLGGAIGDTSEFPFGCNVANSRQLSYRAVVSPFGIYTAANQYVKGWGNSEWLSFQVAVETPATSPVQHSDAQTGGGGTVYGNFSSPPTQGNMIFAFVTTGGPTIHARQADWTEVGSFYLSQPFSDPSDNSRHRTVKVLVRCYTDGDGEADDGTSWGFDVPLAGEPGTSVFLSEWDVTA